MTQDEIIRSPLGREQLVALALEADIDAEAEGLTQALERFAALVAAHEHEKQAEQSQLADASLEPVGYVYDRIIEPFGYCKDVYLTKNVPVGTNLYAAPVEPVKQEPVYCTYPNCTCINGTLCRAKNAATMQQVTRADLKAAFKEGFERAADIYAPKDVQEQAKQEPLMDYERINALREGEQNGAEDAYFFVRPENDTPTLRKMFCQGFERGFHKGIKYAAPVSIESAVLAEREACAKVCEEQSPLDAMVDEEFGSAAMVRVADAMAKLNATAIRARSEQ